MSDQKEQDVAFIKKALSLAKKGQGTVSPNPMVGAIVVKNGEVVGENYHRNFGGPHAEVLALEEAGDLSVGATLYVTLEPCAHHGKTGPCVEAIYDAGISRVVVGCIDPNPIVNGKGIKFLRSKGISVTQDVLCESCQELNQSYIKYITTSIPLITLKLAQTLDGRIATSTGHSKWITTEESRAQAHKLRAQHDAILVGIRTVLSDDPNLTVRMAKGITPKRVVLDSKLRVPLDAKILSDEFVGRTILITTEAASKEKIARIKEKGAIVLSLESDDRGWVLQNILWKKLGELGITSVLVEGGSVVQTECLKNGFADQLVIFIATKLLGSGIDAIGDLGIRNINSAIELTDVSIKKIQSDFMISGKLSLINSGV